ncbi:MAG: ABC-F family ATP-binding cassette domain-containing protein [Firmicutes bacterium]|nr:ABC-F family ATP-binding cassette domain-containing protein [Bacillota bacterium]
MLQIKDLTIMHKKDLRVFLKDFSCALNPGDKAVIIGEEGNGKSTLLRWLYDPQTVEAYADASGERVLGRERLAYLPQELAAEDAARSVYDFFASEPVFWDCDPGRLAKLSSEFGVPARFFYEERLMGTLSGGEKVKAQMMRLLMTEPTALLLDEPSNDIDIDTLEWLERLINGFRGTVLFISHDETLIENTANMVIHLELLHRKQQCRHTVSKVPYAEYVRRRDEAFEKQAQQAKSDLREKRKRDEKYRRILQSVDRAQVTVNHAGKDMPDPMQAARNLKDKMHTVKSMKKRFEREDENMTEAPVYENPIDFKLGEEALPLAAGKTVLDLKLDVLRVRDENGEASEGSGRVLARGVELMVRGPEKICIVGRNGCGKTTLMRIIADELLRRSDLRAEYMPQNYAEQLDMDRTPVENICRRGDAEERTMVRTFLGALRFTTSEMEHPVRELSGGQQAKVFLLRMNTSGANVLILDEPTRNFSPLSGPVIRRMLKSFPGAVISVSHDRRFIDEVCGKVYELGENGLKLRD